MGVLPAGTLKLPSAMLAAIERAARLSWSSFALKWLNDQKDDEWRSVIIRRVGEVVTEEHTGDSSLPGLQCSDCAADDFEKKRTEQNMKTIWA